MLTAEERAAKIESYNKSYDMLVAVLPKFPREMWTFKPSPKDWSIHEIIVHITDSEANSFVRCRRFLAEPGSVVLGYDEALWADMLNYHSLSTETALELFRWLRQSSYELIKPLAASPVWSNTVEHSENGTMTMDEWLDVYDRHVPDHIRQMEEVFSVWQSQL
jgi:hypothetical protein